MRLLAFSYRLADLPIAIRLRDELVRRFGVASVSLGTSRLLGTETVLLAIVGPTWLGSAGDPATLFTAQDHVRIELESALRAGWRVVPVLVGGASMPDAQALPEALHRFALLQPVLIRSGDDFYSDVEHLSGLLAVWAPALDVGSATRAESPGAVESTGGTEELRMLPPLPAAEPRSHRRSTTNATRRDNEVGRIALTICGVAFALVALIVWQNPVLVGLCASKDCAKVEGWFSSWGAHVTQPPRDQRRIRSGVVPYKGTLALVPLPRRMRASGVATVLGSQVLIRANSVDAGAIARQLAADLRTLEITSVVESPSTVPSVELSSAASTLSLNAASATPADSPPPSPATAAPSIAESGAPEASHPVIELTLQSGIAQIGTEGYRLDVGAHGVRISANKPAGLFYGVQTFEQLLSDDGRHAHAVPNVGIVDWPEYGWRGLHLDVSRHFFNVDAVKSYIDVESRLKLNTFHWHLTDDQGWRLEIPQHPRLVSVGGCREATQTGLFESSTTDGLPTCDHYSVKEVRDVVAYAAARFVRVIPEIEGPGHSVEMLAAYPELACAPGPYATMTHWGSTKYAVCPTEATFAFYDDVFREVSLLFPDPLIHIGGDEVPTYSWSSSPEVAALMRAQGLSRVSQVQGYFTERIERIAAKYNKRIVGWNEIMNAGVSRSAIVMAWSGAEAGSTASARGNDVVMTPVRPLYFDAYQGPHASEPPAIGGFTTLASVYGYDPAGIAGAAAREHILGAQANLWTEYIPTPSQLWYMAYPRALALAELCWTPRSEMDWDDFTMRAGIELQRLEPLGVTFRIPPPTFLIVSPALTPATLATNAYRASLPAGAWGATVAVRRFIPDSVVHYTLDGSPPDENSAVYRHPLALKGGQTLRVVAMLNGYRRSPSSSLTMSSL